MTPPAATAARPRGAPTPAAAPTRIVAPTPAAGEAGAHTMRLSLTWVREDGTWRVLAGQAGPAG
jgi:hypothetical protein